MIQALLISSEKSEKYGKQKANNYPLEIYRDNTYIYIYINFKFESKLYFSALVKDN